MPYFGPAGVGVNVYSAALQLPYPRFDDCPMTGCKSLLCSKTPAHLLVPSSCTTDGPKSSQASLPAVPLVAHGLCNFFPCNSRPFQPAPTSSPPSPLVFLEHGPKVQATSQVLCESKNRSRTNISRFRTDQGPPSSLQSRNGRPRSNSIPPGRGSSQPAPTAGVPSINKPSDVQSLGTRPPIHSRSNLATGEGITMPLPPTSTNLPKRSASSPTSWTFALPPSPTGSGWPRNSTRSTPRGTTT